MSADYFMRMYSFKEKLLWRFIGALKWIAAAEMTLKIYQSQRFLVVCVWNSNISWFWKGQKHFWELLCLQLAERLLIFLVTFIQEHKREHCSLGVLCWAKNLSPVWSQLQIRDHHVQTYCSLTVAPTPWTLELEWLSPLIFPYRWH